MSHQPSRNFVGYVAYLTTGSLAGVLGAVGFYLALLFGSGSGILLPPLGSSRATPPASEITETITRDVSGEWRMTPDNGFTYRLTQDGTFLIIREIDSDGRVTGYGEGSVVGSLVSIEFVTLDGSLGTAQLNIAPAWDTLSGTFYSWARTSQEPVKFTRR